MNLFEHLVDVDAVALFPLSVPLLAATWPWCFGRLLGTFLSNLTGWSHFNFTGAIWKEYDMQYQ